MIQYLPVSASELPVVKTFTFNSKDGIAIDYEFLFRLNVRFDFVTLEISTGGKVLFTSKLLYGDNFLSINKTEIPFALVPLDEVDFKNTILSDLKVNSQTLGKNVFIYFDDGV